MRGALGRGFGHFIAQITAGSSHVAVLGGEIVRSAHLAASSGSSGGVLLAATDAPGYIASQPKFLSGDEKSFW